MSTFRDGSASPSGYPDNAARKLRPGFRARGSPRPKFRSTERRAPRRKCRSWPSFRQRQARFLARAPPDIRRRLAHRPSARHIRVGLIEQIRPGHGILGIPLSFEFRDHRGRGQERRTRRECDGFGGCRAPEIIKLLRIAAKSDQAAANDLGFKRRPEPMTGRSGYSVLATGLALPAPLRRSGGNARPCAISPCDRRRSSGFGALSSTSVMSMVSPVASRAMVRSCGRFTQYSQTRTASRLAQNRPLSALRSSGAGNRSWPRRESASETPSVRSARRQGSIRHPTGPARLRPAPRTPIGGAECA